MFDELSGKLTATLRSLTGRGVLTEDAVKEGLREIRRILLEADVSFDLTRDFIEQLQTLGRQIDVGVHGDTGSKDVVRIVRDGIAAAGKARARTVLVDTAGRLQIDDEMMGELKRLKSAISPHEILLVADGMTRQDAVRIAQGFHDALGITGVILTKMDGDARGG